MATTPTGSNGWNYGNWGSSWFDPGQYYGGSPSTDLTGSQIGSGWGGIMEDPSNYDASWMRYASELGYAPGSAAFRWMRQQLPLASEGYRAANVINPDLKFNEYIRGLDINSMYNSLTAAQRGETPGLYAPRARTISRGY